MESFLQDIRFGLRSFGRRPLFSFIAILTLGLGIGSATTIFSVVEGVLLRPLPFDRPDELVTITRTNPEWRNQEVLSESWDRIPVSQPAFRRLQEFQTSFTAVAIYRLGTRTLPEDGEPASVPVGMGTSSLFSVLRVQPVLGRTFLPQEDGPAATRVALVSEELWRERFAADAEILGRSVNLSGQFYTVVGVLPAGLELRSFSAPEPPYARGFWIPLGLESDQFGENNNWYQGIARLRPQVSRTLAEQEASTPLRGEEGRVPYGARVRTLTEAWTGAYQRPLMLLLGASLVLLLIACGNVAALLLGETPARQNEMTTRRALGAGSRRLSLQLLTEGLLLGMAGSAVGVLLSLVGTRVLSSLAPPIPRLEGVAVNGWVLLFSVLAGVLTSLAFGMAPVLQVVRGRAAENLGRGHRIVGMRRGRLHRAVVSGEIALTVLLLVGGGLLTRSLFTLLDVDTGFREEGLIEARVSFPSYLLPEGAEPRLLYREMMDALEVVPGVMGVSATTRLPFSGRMNTSRIQVLGQLPIEEGQGPSAERRRVYPGFFRIMGIPMLQGRDFTEADRSGAPLVAVISRSMAERFWPGQDPLGARFSAHETFTVVGVVGDVRHESLRADPHPTFYLPDAQQATQSATSLVIRTDRDADAVLPEVREAIRRLHPKAPIVRLAPATSLIGESAREERFRAILFGAFAGAAVLLAAAGVFGVTARGVEARRGEMGIRMALGAQRANLMRLTLLPGLSSGLIGLSLGLLGALGTSRLLTDFLFSVETWDPATYGVVAAAVLGISLVATYLPSRRIERLEPAAVLREQ